MTTELCESLSSTHFTVTTCHISLKSFICLFVCLLMHEIYFYAHSYGSLKGYYRGMSQNVYYGWNSV